EGEGKRFCGEAARTPAGRGGAAERVGLLAERARAAAGSDHVLLGDAAEHRAPDAVQRRPAGLADEAAASADARRRAADGRAADVAALAAVRRVVVEVRLAAVRRDAVAVLEARVARELARAVARVTEPGRVRG